MNKGDRAIWHAGGGHVHGYFWGLLYSSGWHGGQWDTTPRRVVQ